MLTGLCAAQLPRYPALTVACPCGGQAHYQRQRTIQVQTLLGRIPVQRPYYLCAACHHGFAPVDAVWGLCANSVSLGLEQVLGWLRHLSALCGGPRSARWGEPLVGIEVAPTTVQEATERVGEAISATEAQAEAGAWKRPNCLRRQRLGKTRLYVSMDGTMVHLRYEADGVNNPQEFRTFSSGASPPERQRAAVPAHRR